LALVARARRRLSGFGRDWFLLGLEFNLLLFDPRRTRISDRLPLE
jgi:hypothetical protein